MKNDSDAFEPYQPKVLAFCCRYCAYTAADLAGSLRLEYAPNVRVVHILCSGRIDAAFLLKAFENGADSVFVAGCNIGDCHFLEGNLSAIRTVAYTKQLLAEIGLEPERLEFFHIAASEGPLFAQRADEMTERARRLGANPLRKTMGRRDGGKLPHEADAHPPLPAARLGRLIRHAERVAGLGNDPAARASYNWSASRADVPRKRAVEELRK
jgi:coenzyme F420-reducing hydrogenase delta subunit